MKSLMGFDQINKLDSQSSTSSSGTSPSTGSTGTAGNGVDYGKLADGDTVIDKTDEKLSALQKRCQELAKTVQEGF